MVWHLRHNEEWSLNVEVEFIVEFSLLWFWFIVLDVHDVPLLVQAIVPIPHVDVLVFSVSV